MYVGQGSRCRCCEFFDIEFFFIGSHHALRLTIDISELQLRECLVFWRNHDRVSCLERNANGFHRVLARSLIGSWPCRYLCLSLFIATNILDQHGNVECQLPISLLDDQFCISIHTGQRYIPCHVDSWRLCKSRRLVGI